MIIHDPQHTPATTEPANQNRDARLYMLGMWVLSLALAAFLPWLGLAQPLSLLMEVLVFAATLITAGLVVFTFRRRWNHPIFFVLGVAASALAYGLMNFTADASPSRQMQSIASVVTALLVDLLWMTCWIGLILIWTGRGGWPLLIIGSVAAMWTPWLMAQATSVESFALVMLGMGGQTGPLNVVFCGALCAVPVAVLALFARVLRGWARETQR